MIKKITKKCLQCGAPLKIPINKKTFECSYCGSRYSVDKELNIYEKDEYSDSPDNFINVSTKTANKSVDLQYPPLTKEEIKREENLFSFWIYIVLFFFVFLIIIASASS